MITANYLTRAETFATDAHASINQRRKYSGEPYIVHPRRVVEIASPFIKEEYALAAYWNHDVFEDVLPLNPFYTLDLFAILFGAFATQIAKDLTDVYTREAYPDKNRKERKTLEVARWDAIGDTPLGYFSQSGKLADLIANTEDITKQDKNFARTYLREKEALLNVLTRGNRELQELAWASLERGLVAIN